MSGYFPPSLSHGPPVVPDSPLGMQGFVCLRFVLEKEYNDNDTRSNVSARSPVFCGDPVFLLPTRVANPVARFVEFWGSNPCVLRLYRVWTLDLQNGAREQPSAAKRANARLISCSERWVRASSGRLARLRQLAL